MSFCIRFLVIALEHNLKMLHDSFISPGHNPVLILVYNLLNLLLYMLKLHNTLFLILLD